MTDDREQTPAPRERELVRELARQYMEICANPVQAERRALWRGKNSLKPVRPLIYVRAYAWGEMPESACECEHPLMRHAEGHFKRMLFVNTFGDDHVFEPWLTLGARHACTDWGLHGRRRYSDEARGSWKLDYPIRALEDADRMRRPWHEIDEAATARDEACLRDALGDLIPIEIDRAPAFRVWRADLSTDLGHLRGIENFMLDMLDNPEWLHRLLAFMRDGVLHVQQQAEEAGDWGLSNHQNQSMSYAQELEDPAAGVTGVARRRLWVFAAAQEFTAVSPQMHEEFLLQYQLPILANFGLVAYGCCEDLTHKIDMLRRIPRLRRIAVAPAADVARCAEQIGRDYVISYRPSPSDMVGYGFDRERMRRILRRDLSACREGHVDVTLKDVETVQGEPERIREFVRICRETIDELWG